MKVLIHGITNLILAVFLISGASVKNLNINNENFDSAENAIIEEVTGPSSTISSTTSSSSTLSHSTIRTEKNVVKKKYLVCPNSDKRQFFSISCKSNEDCAFLGKNVLCCNDKCSKGVPPPIVEPTHEATFFGLIERRCPSLPIPELFEVKECNNDRDCGGRICCPEQLPDGKTVGYCRTAEPNWDKIPMARPLIEPLRNIVSYMQCTPPPPPFLDLFPKACNNPLDCFPNLCCQEGGKKYCRPPKRSFLALVADVGQRILPEEAARKFFERFN